MKFKERQKVKRIICNSMEREVKFVEKVKDDGEYGIKEKRSSMELCYEAYK